MNEEKLKQKFNPDNERMKYKYRKYLRRLSQKDEKTIISALKHIRAYESFTGFLGFERFNDDVADKYVESMFNKELSLSFITDNLRSVRDFLSWLERQHGYRSKINYEHIPFLNVSKNQRRTAKAKEYQKAYKYEDILLAIRSMPIDTDKGKRDRAVVSLQALCALRISELRTVKLKSLVEEDGIYFIYITPKNMKTKFAKSRQVVFMPLPDDIKANVVDWVKRLKAIGFKESDPLFPIIDSSFNKLNLLDQEVKRKEIRSDTTVRNIFKRAFHNVGLEYLNPHSFRHTLARYAQKQSPAFLNAVRQNLGHSSIDTTLTSYGNLSDLDQRLIISQELFDDK